MGFYFIVLIVLIGTVGVLLSKSPSNQPIYSDIVRLFEEEKVKEFVIDDSVLTATLYDGSTVVYSIPYLDLFFDELGDLISAQRQSGVIQHEEIKRPASLPWWAGMVPYVILIVIFGVFWYFMMNKADGGARGAMNFGKSKARLGTPVPKKVRFN